MVPGLKMRNIDKNYFEFIKFSVNQDYPFTDSVESINWEDLYRFSKEQSIIGICFDGIQKLDAKVSQQINKHLLYRWIAANHHIEIVNNHLNSTLCDLVQIFLDNSIKYCVFKGQTIAALYPNSLSRICGDIDFYCPAIDYAKAQKVLKQKLSVEIEHSEIADKHDTFVFNGVRCEMHFRLETFGSHKHQVYFDQMIDKALDKSSFVTINGFNICVLPANENIILTFKHLFNHLLVEGVGLRQFCDLMILIKNKYKEIDVEQLALSLHNIGYYNAFCAVGAVLIKYLGLSEKEFPFPISSRYYRWGDEIINTVLHDGNFGQNHRNGSFGIMKSLNTAYIAMCHCVKFLMLAPSDIIYLIPKRIYISTSKYI